MRIDSLRHLAVIDPDTACRTGTVTDYWLDAAAGRVTALVLRPFDIDQAQRVSSARVEHIGHDAVMLTRSSGQPVFSLAPVPEDWLDRRHLKQLTVYSDDGDRLGRVAEAHIDPLTLNIQSYELAVPFWRRWLPARRQVPGNLIAWCGRDVLVVRTDQPAKLRPVGREDGNYVQLSAEQLPSRANSVSRNGSVAV